MNDVKLLNIEKICDVLMLEEDSVKKLLQKFAIILPETMVEIEDAIGTGDMELVKRLGHKLKGTAGNFRIDELQQVAELLENSALHMTDLEAVLASLHKTVNALIVEITVSCKD